MERSMIGVKRKGWRARTECREQSWNNFVEWMANEVLQATIQEDLTFGMV